MQTNHNSHRDWGRTAAVLCAVLVLVGLAAIATSVLSITGAARIPAGVLLALGVATALLFVARMFAVANLQLDEEDTDR